MIRFIIRYRDSSVRTVTRLRAGRPGFNSWQGHKRDFFPFATAFRPALGTTQPLTQCVPGTLSFGIKRPGSEADNSPPPSTEVKNACSYTPTLLYVFMAYCLVKHRDNFIFHFYYYLLVLPLDFLNVFLISLSVRHVLDIRSTYSLT
jgi:hypothetical protein